MSVWIYAGISFLFKIYSMMSVYIASSRQLIIFFGVEKFKSIIDK